MGFVWSVMLSFSNEEYWEDDEDEPREKCEPLEQINAWIEGGRLTSLTAPTFRKSAGYDMDANLYGGGFKHFDIEGFIQTVIDQDWKDRAKVQLWVKGGTEGMCDDPFTLVKLGRPKATRTRSKASPSKKGTPRK